MVSNDQFGSDCGEADEGIATEPSRGGWKLFIPPFPVGMASMICFTKLVGILLLIRLIAGIADASSMDIAALDARSGLLLALWLTLAVGVWLQRSWARWGLRAAASTEVASHLVLSWAMGRMPSLSVGVCSNLILCWLAWSMRFRYELAEEA